MKTEQTGKPILDALLNASGSAHTPESYDGSVHPSYPSGNSPLTAPIDWQAAAKEAARRYTETAAERDRLKEQLDELLAACKEALPLVESLVLDGEPYFDQQEQMRAAIRSAEGSAQP